MATAKRDLTDTEVQGQLPLAERVLLPVEAAALLRVSLDQLYHLTSKKKVPFTKVGGALRFDRLQLLDFIASGSVGTGEVPSGANRAQRKVGSRGSNGSGHGASSKSSGGRFTFNTSPRPRRAREK